MSFKNDFGLSLGLHVAIFLACLTLLHQRAAVIAPPRSLVIEVADILPKTPRQKNEVTKQVVRTQKVRDSSVPEKDAFLGERNQTVDRQTVAARGGLKAGARPRAAERQRQVDLSKLGVAVPSPLTHEPQVTPGEGPLREYVSGVKEGQETALSTREYVFFGYFERIRSQLDRAWEPILRDHLLRHYRQGRRLAGEMDHRTEVLVILDGRGGVVGVQVVGESGTETLDSAAVQAFNRAGPFPNPPRGLVGQDGKVRIRWEFILKT